MYVLLTFLSDKILIFNPLNLIVTQMRFKVRFPMKDWRRGSFQNGRIFSFRQQNDYTKVGYSPRLRLPKGFPILWNSSLKKPGIESWGPPSWRTLSSLVTSVLRQRAQPKFVKSLTTSCFFVTELYKRLCPQKKQSETKKKEMLSDLIFQPTQIECTDVTYSSTCC